jgi:hypothetical protein
MRLLPGLPSLWRPQEHEVLLGAFRSGCQRFGFRLVHYAVLEDQLQLLTQGKHRRGHARGVQGLAIRIAKRLNRLWKRKGKVFCDRFQGKDLKTPREVRGMVAYLDAQRAAAGTAAGSRAMAWDTGSGRSRRARAS